jgi:hypothetical protein
MKQQFNIKSKFSLFATGAVQVYFVAINTYFLSREFYLGVTFAAFMISMIWSHNIKKIAFGTTMDRVLYSLGATLGSLAGLATSKALTNLISQAL